MTELHDEETSTHSNEPLKLSTPVDTSRSRFPQCIVWTPLPIVSWLAPFVGHVGVCREDGTILDFAGSYLVNVDNLAFGGTARYAHLDGQQCCFPPHLSGHTCESRFQHAELGTAVSWDDGLRSCMCSFQHKSYNLFTCNCHSFVASFLNRIAYRRSIKWNVIDVATLALLKGQWVSKWAVARSFAAFTLVMCLGLLVAGWPFFAAWAVFDFLLIAWFIFAAYVRKGLIE